MRLASLTDAVSSTSIIGIRPSSVANTRSSTLCTTAATYTPLHTDHATCDTSSNRPHSSATQRHDNGNFYIVHRQLQHRRFADLPSFVCLRTAWLETLCVIYKKLSLLPQTRYVSKNSSTVETSLYNKSTANRSIELQGYSWPTSSKQPWLVDSRWLLTTKRNVMRYVDDDDDNFCWQRDRLAVEKFSKSGVWDNVSEVSNLIFGDNQPYNRV